MPYKILILSDSHLFGSRDKELFGVNTYDSLNKVTDHIKCSDDTYDLLVASGDLSEDGHHNAYKDFSNSTRDLASSSIWIKGNHDQFHNVPDDLAKGHIHAERHMDPWNCIFLDTTIQGKDEGALSEKELQRLKVFLEKYRGGHIFIFMHHQPMDVGSVFIDVLGLYNKQAFWDLIASYPNIRGLLFGHVHQEIDQNFNGIRLLASPSTSVQFKPFSRELDFDSPTLGYRNIILNRDGSIETHVVRIDSERNLSL